MYDYQGEPRSDLSAVPVKVVVADDDALQRAYFSAILTKLGFEPHEAEDGCRALDLVNELSAKILICDLEMPGMNGYELARRIRQDSSDHYIHILMVTGQNQRNEREHALEAGIDDFMAKPLDTASLTARVRSASRLLRHEEQLRERSRIIAEAKERIEDDLRAAANAQRRLLPDEHRDVGKCSFHAAFRPSNILSGDMFGYFPVSEAHTAFYAVDVAGHGVHASLMSVALGHLLTAEYFTAHAFDAEGRPDPAALVHGLNDRFYRDDGTEYFTMFCGIVEHASDRLYYCQAGYPSPYKVSLDGTANEVGDGGFPVALLLNVAFETRNTPFHAQEAVALFSDGATEAENFENQPFGEARVEAVLKDVRDPAMIPDKLVDALDQWRNGRTLDDDLTVLVCERTPQP
ncbi:PP2C family protein-serine/threonine phosphatase [Salipiger mucosus]|uniref:Serine phosphatase RsbU, regulator of sigma subunit n=1 Tax=Salipiger mucosus DSM 16094 TaxID=1123237 RepID=S9Q2C4_9RHOB|nr:SpoIIE family protein phosphatase [Salipiger mucosus]EPX75436.1 Serine phosphatase RsbU, regulator of sigma subunit [Salipiger mucosus DSM 16094]